MNERMITAQGLTKTYGRGAKAVEAGQSHVPDYILARTLSQRATRQVERGVRAVAGNRKGGHQ